MSVIELQKHGSSFEINSFPNFEPNMYGVVSMIQNNKRFKLHFPTHSAPEDSNF